MEERSFVKFVSVRNEQVIYKVAVFTLPSYRELILNRGINYVLDLFMEVCRDKNCRFLGLNFEGGYVFALLGFEHEYILKKRKTICLSACGRNSLAGK
ncbi:MAG: hypothetical protein WC527_02620 [Candidatus Margulisiibacteriota bacterium]